MNDISNDPRAYDPSTSLEAQVRAELDERGSVPQEHLAAVFDIKAQAMASDVQAGKRVFVSPRYKNYKKLIHRGKPTVVYAGTSTPFIPGSGQPGGTEIRRIGDVFAQFVGGVMVIDPSTEDGRLILEWAESHPQECRDAMNPGTEIWAALKEGQLNLANKEPSIPTNIDIDRVLRGDYGGFAENDSIVSRARTIIQGKGQVASHA